jgi:hypothetical protein
MRIRRVVMLAVAAAGIASAGACTGGGSSPTLADNGPGAQPPPAPTDTSGFVPPVSGMGH